MIETLIFNQGPYNDRILGKKSEIQPNALFWSEFGGIFKSSEPLGFVYRFAAVDGFGKPGKSAAAAAITLTTQGEMCI